VLGDVAVGHPQPGVADVEQEVDHLAGADQHASGRVRLNTRVLAVLVSHKRTTSPALADSRGLGSPATRNTLPKRPMAA
jgi:hypothetical protein